MDLGEKVLVGAMNNVAGSYSDLGRMQEAIDLGEKVLEARQRTLGSEHPDTLGTMHNLAICYSDPGRMQEAIEMGQKFLEASQRTLRSEHPMTLRAMNILTYLERKKVRDIWKPWN